MAGPPDLTTSQRKSAQLGPGIAGSNRAWPAQARYGQGMPGMGMVTSSTVMSGMAWSGIDMVWSGMVRAIGPTPTRISSKRDQQNRVRPTRVVPSSGWGNDLGSRTCSYDLGSRTCSYTSGKSSQTKSSQVKSSQVNRLTWQQPSAYKPGQRYPFAPSPPSGRACHHG